MPRRARTMSESGYMHIIVRGIGKQLLFEEPADYKHYLKKLEKYCLETEVKICAYCLMENHVHFLAKGNSASIILLMKKIGVSYSGYFNKKYDRVGHLFQDRYLSEPIENEGYLLTVYRYILQNPEKAGICKSSQYTWSSYKIFENVPEFMDLSVVKAFLRDRTRLESFILQKNDEKCLDNDRIKKDDEWAKEKIKLCLGVASGTVLQSFEKEERDEALIKLKKSGLSIRQIERLTGINRNIIQRLGR